MCVAAAFGQQGLGRSCGMHAQSSVPDVLRCGACELVGTRDEQAL